MDDGAARLGRFVVTHSQCGDVSFSEFSEEDILDEDGLHLQISARCGECGDTIRESADLADLLAGLAAAIRKALAKVEQN